MIEDPEEWALGAACESVHEQFGLRRDQERRVHQNPAVKFRCKEGAAGRHGPQRVGEGGQRYTRPNPMVQRLDRG